MLEMIKNSVVLLNGKTIIENDGHLTTEYLNQKLKDNGEAPMNFADDTDFSFSAMEGTMAGAILKAHNVSQDENLFKIRFDAMASHDITYVGIIQTARASGLTSFPIPYVLTNCHNSLCAVGGTINQDDHVFGLSAAKKYGGIYVPPHQAVIHQYMREMMAGCGKMILGSDSHTRYGALGALSMGEGGPELVKQLLGKTYDISTPPVIAVYLEGSPKEGVGPQDVALSIIGAVFKNGFVKNAVMEFVGPGISNLSVDYRNGIDVMTTETACLSSIWRTDTKVLEYYRLHGRAEAYRKLDPAAITHYDGCIRVDLSKIECMVALPFHPSNVYTIREFNANAKDILASIEKDAKAQFGDKSQGSLLSKVDYDGFHVDQAVIAGCSGGTFENICRAREMVETYDGALENLPLSVYPASQPVFLQLVKNGAVSALMQFGATVRSAFCGPCFGAGDVPENNGFSIRHTTRNFPNREGSNPSAGQIAYVALMDARSIVATALNGGVLTPATDYSVPEKECEYVFDQKIYKNTVYYGFGNPEPEHELRFGPNIANWPEIKPLSENLLLQVASVILDPVTTTDELIPSGETSSYRSNPMKLAEFTLSRRDPGYVARAKNAQALEYARDCFLHGNEASSELKALFNSVLNGVDKEIITNTAIGSLIFANKPGDGSAREQAASCQRVLGGSANIAVAYATKRYRSNVINWGMLPFVVKDGFDLNLEIGEWVYLPGIRKIVEQGKEEVEGVVILKDGEKRKVTLLLAGLTQEERKIILAGCLINHYRMMR